MIFDRWAIPAKIDATGGPTRDDTHQIMAMTTTPLLADANPPLPPDPAMPLPAPTPPGSPLVPVTAPGEKPGLFARLYLWMRQAARHRFAFWWLGAVGFAESSFFPLPPDIMLAPMVLETPRRWAWLASWTTLASVLGGALGYAIGVGLKDLIVPWVTHSGYAHAYAAAVGFYAVWGFWAIAIKGISPIPYKVFTITAGVLGMAFWPFMLASTIGRGSRFFLVAGLMRAFGPRIEPLLFRYIERIGWVVLGLLVLLILWVKLK